MSEYFAMGGYAVFIWPSYGVAAILLVALFLLSARRLRAGERALDDKHAPGGDSSDPSTLDGDA